MSGLLHPELFHSDRYNVNAAWRESFVAGSDSTRLYVRFKDVGASLTCVLCDGIACDGFIWRYLANDLAAHANVLHWNYRGHGRSSAPYDPNRIGLSDLVDDLDAVRKNHAQGPTVLVGHSMGCQIALESYRQRPDSIAGLVLLCGTPGRMTYTFKGGDVLAQALPRLIKQVKNHPLVARALWANFPPEVATRLALATGEVDAATVLPEDLTAYTEHAANLDLQMFLRMLHDVGERTASDMLRTINVPVLIVAGSLDTFTPPHLAEEMAAAIPDSELVVLEGASHVLPIERRDETRRHVTRFIEERIVTEPS